MFTFTNLATAFLLSLLSAKVTAAYEVAAYSGNICSGAELGFLEDEQNTPGESAVEVTPNGHCISFQTDFPQDCDVYLCVDPACDDQGETVAGPRDAGTRVESVNFQAIQVGCQ